MAASEGSAEAARCGIDVFRIFDSLNWVPGMEVAIDEVLNQGKVCEASICYTGDILDPKRDRYTIAYYVDMAKELERRADSDMKLAFSMYPTSITELLAVADAGQLMPPKSTWFEPKLRSGLFIHKL